MTDFETIRSEGGLLPYDLLRRLLDPTEKLAGIRPEDYGLPRGERLTEVITPAWNRLRKHWLEFRADAASLPAGEPGTGLTNDKWSLPLLRELGFGLLPVSAGPEVAGRSYAINRFFGDVPIHLVGCGLSLDRRAAGVRGAAAANPHGLVQEFLNRSPRHLWGIVTNGLRLRILRDNQALSRQSFLEFDLEAMFGADLYSDFALLWLSAHATRFAPRDGAGPETCWLEVWTKAAEEQGTRALGDLRTGVERALQILGQGFTSHPQNMALRDKLRSGEVSLTEFHGELLRVIYRLIFLFVAEDRSIEGLPLLHPQDTSDAARLARQRYAAYYSTARLRELASTIKGSRHSDLWRQFQLVVGALSGDLAFSFARDRLALPMLGSLLWAPTSTAALNNAELANFDLLDALRHLAFTRQGSSLRTVAFRDLAAEELGGIYESLLALTPQISADGAHFAFAEFAGNERKTSGSYYTPDALVESLLDSALDPVVEEATKGKTGVEAEKAILDLTVCDPAVGSGHFLVGAARRLAHHLSRVRALAAGESAASPLLYQHALRDVIGHCLYGVDVNPMAAELCRVSLWLEALEPGRPLSFLGHHIRVGNSLIGASPELIVQGLPDEAFTPLKGDDKKACAVLRKRNKAERKAIGPLFSEQDNETQLRLAEAAAALDQLPDDRPEDVHAKELLFARREQTEEYRQKKILADTWCAAFIIHKTIQEPGSDVSVRGITMRHLNDLACHLRLSPELEAEITLLANQYQFFHWHLAFPEVFARGGFDCVLGNPPWEHTELKEKEWFAERRPDISNAHTGDQRKRMIEALRETDPPLYAAFIAALREHDSLSHFLGNSGRYPFCGRGRINTYAVFAESMRNLINPRGYVGGVLPTGIATDDTTKLFFESIVSTRSLVSLLSFENEELIFPAVHHSVKFCLLTCGGLAKQCEAANFVFFARSIDDLLDPDRRFSLSAEDIALLNPNTRTCPSFRSRRDADLTKAIYMRMPPLIREGMPEANPWCLTIRRIFNMGISEVSARARTISQVEQLGMSYSSSAASDPAEDHPYLPMLEGKMIFQFDHRFGTYEGQTVAQANQGKLPEVELADHANPFYTILPRFCVPRSVVESAVSELTAAKWLLCWRDFTQQGLSRTTTAAVIPMTGTDFTLRVGFLSERSAINSAMLLATLNSFIFDYCSRQMIGGTHLSDYILKQLPVPAIASFDSGAAWDHHQKVREWILPRVLELSYTAWDLEPFARDCGCLSPPFFWNEDRRFFLRCELDAAFFHLYLPADKRGEWYNARSEEGEHFARLKDTFTAPRDAVAYILDTFPIVRHKDEVAWGGSAREKLNLCALES